MKKELLCLLLAASYFFGVKSQDRGQPNKIELFHEQLRILEKQIAYHLGIEQYSPMLISKFESLLDGLIITDELRNRNSTVKSDVICWTCLCVIGKLQRNILTVENVATFLCEAYIAYNNWNDICQEIIEINKPILEYILRHSKILSPKYACSILLQNEDCYDSDPALTWRIDIPEGGPTLHPQMLKSQNDQSMPLKILHLSDFHISHDYELGGLSNCRYPLCCKKGLGDPLFGQAAGPWTDYNCDIPPWLFLNTLEFLNNTHKDIDLIYFTGDIIDHTIWKASKQDNSREITYTFRSLADFFPNVAVLPAIGNHESVPLNVFAPPEITDETFSQNWLYELNANLWSRWLPNEGLSTIRKQGYFSVLANYKLRVIVLNNNVCYKFNWWLLYDTNFLKEQLEFLKNELREAESHGQYVHIVSHIFPGEKECIEPWEVNYNSLVTRFAHIIKGQFFGHTHTDGLKIFYSKIDGRPNNIGYNGASLTPYVKYNPNYKIISVDPNSFDILDIETYYFNLTEANKYPNRTPRWQRLYSMKEAYGLNDLTPENFDLLADQLSNDNNLFDKYWRFYVRNGDASLQDGCDASCRTELISSIKRTESLTSY